MAQGIILAGGYSSRAKTNKLLLKYDGKYLLEYAIENMSPFVSDIFVVTGFYDKEIKDALKNRSNVKVIYNKDFNLGMFSSIIEGVIEVDDDFFILPGDCPFVSKETYIALLNGKKDIRVPSFNKRNGHPIFMKHKIRDELLKENKNSNLKIFRNRHDYEIINTNDDNILNDIDTIEDYNNLILKKRKDK